jgi:hypothetical protein
VVYGINLSKAIHDGSILVHFENFFFCVYFTLSQETQYILLFIFRILSENLRVLVKEKRKNGRIHLHISCILEAVWSLIIILM